MRLVVIGFNHKNTPLALREDLAFSRDQTTDLSKTLINQEVIEECLVISTCNRTEIYCIGSCVEGAKATVYQMLAEKLKTESGNLEKVSYCYDAIEALRHLFRVASSLDAMVVGEAQVLGQFKAAYQNAVEYNMVGPYLHKACHAAFRVAKRVRTDTGIAALPVSIGSLAVDLAMESFKDFNKTNVLLIGAGEMSSLVANHLKENSVSHIWIANRSQSAADALANSVNGIAVPFESWNVHMQTADIVVSSVGGGTFIKRSDVEAAMGEKRSSPLVIIDLAVPRNVEPSVSKIDGVRLYNIDDLQGLAEKNLSARRESAEAAEKIVEEESCIVFQELQQIKLAPMISDLHKKCASIVQTELQKLHQDYPQMTEEEKESVRACVESIVKKILHDPIRLAKEELARPGSNGKEVAGMLHKIFQINSSPKAMR